jgi:hypothetical protein
MFCLDAHRAGAQPSVDISVEGPVQVRKAVVLPAIANRVALPRLSARRPPQRGARPGDHRPRASRHNTVLLAAFAEHAERPCARSARYGLPFAAPQASTHGNGPLSRASEADRRTAERDAAGSVRDPLGVEAFFCPAPPRPQMLRP